VGMHARLVGRALLPIPHPQMDHPSATAPRTWWRAMVEWLNPLRAWRDLREQRIGPREMASGVALGVFIGNLPLYGVHTLLSLYAARRLHLNPWSVVVGSHVSTPPAGPVLIATAIGVGNWIL